MGTYERPETEVNLGTVTDVLNNKVDLDGGNYPGSGLEEKIVSLIPDNSSLIAGYAMPSDKYIDLTLGASGTTYTAPANGWYYLAKSSTASGQTASIRVYKLGTTNALYGQEYASYAKDVNMKYTWAVKKGVTTIIDYTLGGTTNVFRFIYAQGEV